MSSLFLGQLSTTGVPADEKTVRSTTAPYYRDAPAAMAEDMPEMQELETDSNPDLGLAPRQMASKWVDGNHVVTQDATVAMQNESNQVIARQVSTSGTAADRELAGETHRTLSYAVGIEPVFDLADPNHKMGNTYFMRTDRDIQSTAGNYMSVPPGQDHAIEGNIAAYGKTAARDAAQSALYNSWWNGGQS
jgi:hypothetical protein